MNTTANGDFNATITITDIMNIRDKLKNKCYLALSEFVNKTVTNEEGNNVNILYYQVEVDNNTTLIVTHPDLYEEHKEFFSEIPMYNNKEHNMKLFENMLIAPVPIAKMF